MGTSTARRSARLPALGRAALLAAGAALGVLVLDGPSVVGAAGLAVVIALMLPGALARGPRR